MSPGVGRRRFAPQAWAVVLTALLVAAFVSLGWWQLGRAHEKRAMLESFEHGTTSSVALDGAGAGHPDPMPGQRRGIGRLLRGHA